MTDRPRTSRSTTRLRSVTIAIVALVMLLPAGAATARHLHNPDSAPAANSAAAHEGHAGHHNHAHGAAPAAADDRYDYREDLARVRAATAAYHDRTAAIADGYVEFLDCFESDEGGMGQHYVDVDRLDGELDPLRPEAMVYEVNGRRHTLVAVEWIVPGTGAETPPRLFEQDFHFNGTLGVWVLHAWVWKPNPNGVFYDWNPRARGCP